MLSFYPADFTISTLNCLIHRMQMFVLETSQNSIEGSRIDID